MEFGSTSLTNYLFDFFKAPFTKRQQPPPPPPPPSNDQTQQQEIQTEQQQETEQQPQPQQQQQQQTSKQEQQQKHLPTAFSPNFPSLTRPSQTQSIPITSLTIKNRRSSRLRTLYLGPGQSLISNSNRIANARRNQRNTPVTAEESPKQQLQHEPSGSKRTKPNLSTQRHTPSQSTFATPQAKSLQPRQTIDHQSLKPFKSHFGTPIRPSPLRNVTIPSPVASSSPQPLRSESVISLASNSQSMTPKKRKLKQASSIMSSVMKEVNLEIQSRSPAPSPIKPSEVINPYANLQRPIRNKPTILPRPSSPKNKKKNNKNIISSAAEAEARKRKLQGCLDGNFLNDPSTINLVHQDRVNPMQDILQQTMPKEYRQENPSGPKRKTQQVGKLPERLIKKQKLREEMKRNQTSDPHPSSAPPQPSSPSNPHVSSPPEPPKPTKVIEKGPPTNRTVVGQQSIASPTKPSTSTVPASSVGLTSASSAVLDPSFSPLHAPSTVPGSSLAPISAQSLFSKQSPTSTLTFPAVNGNSSFIEKTLAPPTQGSISLDQPHTGLRNTHQEIIDQVLALEPTQIFNSFDQNLLQNFSPSANIDDDKSGGDEDVITRVMAVGPTQLPSFLLS